MRRVLFSTPSQTNQSVSSGRAIWSEFHLRPCYSGSVDDEHRTVIHDEEPKKKNPKLSREVSAPFFFLSFRVVLFSRERR